LVSLFILLNGNKIYDVAFYELLGVEFIREFDDFDLGQKSAILFAMAACDVDGTNVLKSTHALVGSLFEVYSLQKQQGGHLLTHEEPLDLPVGLYTAQQQKYLTAASVDITNFTESQLQSIKADGVVEK